MAKGWVYRAPPQTPRRLRRPNWVALRGSSDAAVLARAALATELDRKVAEGKPTIWPEVVSLGVGVARAVLGEEPRQDHRLLANDRWNFGRTSESRLLRYDIVNAWLGAKEVEWWDDKARQVQNKADQGDAFGVFATFKELRHRVCLWRWERSVQRMSN